MDINPEFAPNETPELQDILDSLELTFFGIPLADCSPDDLPIQHDIFRSIILFNCKYREKEGFDTASDCRVAARHAMCDTLQDDGEVFHENIVMIEWERRVNNILVIDLADSLITFATTDETDGYVFVKAEDASLTRLRALAKQTLAALTSL